MTAQYFSGQVAGLRGPAHPTAIAFDDQLNLLERNGSVYSYAAPYIDGSVLRWPSFFQRVLGGTYVERLPSNGAKWFEVTVPLAEVEGRFLVYYDAADNTVKKLAVYSDTSGLGGDDKPVLAQVASGALNAGVKSAPILRNDFDANSMGRPTLLGVDTSMVRTNGYAEVAGMGIFIGYASTDRVVSVGGLFSSPEAQRMFARVFVYDADAAPGTPIVPDFETFNAAHLADRSTGLTTRGAVLEKVYSNRLRSYLVDNRAASTKMVGIQAVLNTSGRNVILAGLQFAASNDTTAVVPVIDLGGRPQGDRFGKIYFPPELAIFSDRPINLYPTNFIDRRPMDGDLMTLSRDGETGARQPVAAAGKIAIPVSPESISDGDALVLARHFDYPLRDQVQYRPITARKVTPAQLAGKTIKLAFIGDSKVEDAVTATAVEQILEAYGATVERYGTLGEGTALHEGRGGKTLADYVGKVRTNIPPVAAPADYIGSAGRSFLNPFLFAGTGTGSYDGYIFDYAQYQAAYASIIGGVANLAVVDLGTNDMPLATNEDEFTDFIDQGTTRIITSVRSTGTKVLITPPAVAWNSYWYEVYTRMGYPLLRGLMRAVKRFNDPLNVRLSSSFAQMSPFAYGEYQPSQVDDDTGMILGAFKDDTHPKREVRTQDAIAIAADIAVMMR